VKNSPVPIYDACLDFSFYISYQKKELPNFGVEDKKKSEYYLPRTS
jgi:hypothetical protein